MLYPLAFVPQSTGGQQLISEWQPPDLRQLGFAPFGLSVLLAFGLGLGRRPLRTAELLWGLAFTLLALQSVRNIQLYATVVTPLIGARLREVAPSFGRGVREWRRSARLAVLWTMIVVLCGAVWAARFATAGGGMLQLGADPSSAGLPVAGATYLREHAAAGNLFNQFEWGWLPYLIYANFPREHVFIDGRPDTYGQRLFDDYVLVISLAPGWRDILDRYGVRFVLVDAGGPLAAEIRRDPQWRALYADPVEGLFERVD